MKHLCGKSNHLQRSPKRCSSSKTVSAWHLANGQFAPMPGTLSRAASRGPSLGGRLGHGCPEMWCSSCCWLPLAGFSMATLNQDRCQMKTSFQLATLAVDVKGIFERQTSVDRS